MSNESEIYIQKILTEIHDKLNDEGPAHVAKLGTLLEQLKKKVVLNPRVEDVPISQPNQLWTTLKKGFLVVCGSLLAFFEGASSGISILLALGVVGPALLAGYLFFGLIAFGIFYACDLVQAFASLSPNKKPKLYELTQEFNQCKEIKEILDGYTSFLFSYGLERNNFAELAQINAALMVVTEQIKAKVAISKEKKHIKFFKKASSLLLAIFSFAGGYFFAEPVISLVVHALAIAGLTLTVPGWAFILTGLIIGSIQFLLYICTRATPGEQAVAMLLGWNETEKESCQKLIESNEKRMTFFQCSLEKSQGSPETTRQEFSGLQGDEDDFDSLRFASCELKHA